MSTPSAAESSDYRRKRMIGLFLVLLGGFYCLAHLYAVRQDFTRYMGIDFRAVYGSSRCLIAGCNPYYFEDMRAQFLEHGGSLAEALTPTYGPFQPHYVGYPPPTLFYMVPFALLRWPLAFVSYMSVSIALYVIAVMLFADLCSQYVPIAASACLGLFLAIQEKIVLLGQPTLLAAALLCIGLWCLIKNRYPRLGVLSFAFSLMMKPPLGGLFLLYFLLATPSYRKRAFQVIGLTVLLCLPPLLWFATHSSTRNWRQDLQTNISTIAAPGNLSDPGPRHPSENSIIDLQTIVSLYRDEPSFYNHVVWAFSAIVIVVWLYPVIRRPPSQEKDILCLAAIAAFSMLPIYHRTYDTRALLILFPALALLMQRTVWWGRVAAMLTVLTSFVLSDWYSKRSGISGHLIQSLIKRHLYVLQMTIFHVAPLILLVVTIFYLVVLYFSPVSLALESKSDRGFTRPA